MDERMGENLKIYHRQLTAQLQIKDGQFTDLQTRFSKLQGRFAELDYAFKKNLLLHQQQMIEIYDLRLYQKELRKIDKERWNQIRNLEDQLVRITKEKETAENNSTQCKQALIDQENFHEGKLQDCVKEYKSRIEAIEIGHRKTLRESQSSAEKHIQELTNRSKLNEKEVETSKKKIIMLQGEVDVLRYRTEELSRLMESFPQIGDHLRIIFSCLVKVLRNLSTSGADYDERIKELREELLRQISHPTVTREVNISDYETLKSQNTVLREVVKKLKNELTEVQKSSEAIVSKPLVENCEIEELRNELMLSNRRKEKLLDLLAEKNNLIEQLEIENKENIKKLGLNLKLINSWENDKRPAIILSRPTTSRTNNCVTKSKAVQEREEKLGIYSESQGDENFDDDVSEEAHWELLREAGGRVEKFKERTAGRDMIKSFELNLEPLNSVRNSEKNDVTLKNTQKVEEATSGYSNVMKNEHPKLTQVRLEPVESHLNSVRYKEYTVSVSSNQNLKIRHPIAPGSSTGILPFRTVYSQEEYRDTPIDEAVVCLDFVKSEAFLPKSKTMNCAVQTLSIPVANVFTQTTGSKETLTSQANTGIKILNSERRAIERSLRDLEKTVADAGEETLEHARSMIVNTRKFPPSQEFFDCVRYLARSEATSSMKFQKGLHIVTSSNFTTKFPMPTASGSFCARQLVSADKTTIDNIISLCGYWGDAI